MQFVFIWALAGMVVKLTKATELGIKASWTTANHLDALSEVIDAFRARFDTNVELVETAQENIEFKVPRILRERRENVAPIAAASSAVRRK